MRNHLLPAVTRRALILGGAGAAALAAVPGVAASPSTRTGSWATAPEAAAPDSPPLAADRTVRQVVHLSLGGTAPAIRFTNVYGTAPVRLGRVWAGLRAGGPDSAAMWPATIRPVTFGGRSGAVLPAGGTLLGDPVSDLPVAAGDNLVISFHLPESDRIETLNKHSYQRNHILTGDVAAVPDPGGGVVTAGYLLLGGVSVDTPGPSSAVVAFGDSITCGAGSTVGANRRWPDLLAARIGAAGLPVGVLNAGIGGNRLLPAADVPDAAGAIGPAAVRRFAGDVLAQPGATHVITLIGVNDLGHGVGATALIAGHRRLIARARAAGVSVFGGTVLPFAGSVYDEPAHRAARNRLNQWIREGGEFDAVIDFAAAVRDPASPERLWHGYDSGDHLHPNDAGALALAAAVPLTLFQPPKRDGSPAPTRRISGTPPDRSTTVVGSVPHSPESTTASSA
ncbi:hypothetical protein Asi03nite_31070 [Actinoplanes siamensis]|uniref:SGNH hydrolase-type esterase domain-containing protein n=1 Tax=Actinoplanes siamensis TaxID=1223317 RepID=A0A919N6W7_9ACTN|nr:hypothetical protein Asi03nite_31070 [Actinoplanes siamensis]